MTNPLSDSIIGICALARDHLGMSWFAVYDLAGTAFFTLSCSAVAVMLLIVGFMIYYGLQKERSSDDVR